jgi:hypothetical protein
MDGLTGLALRIGNFLQRALQNGAAEDRTGQVKTIKLTAMRVFKKKLDSRLGAISRPMRSSAEAR